jgi:hypothetical protein
MVPSRNLVDGQRTTITAAGFEPDTAIQVLACEGTVAEPPRDARSCEGVTLDSSGYTDGNGSYRNAPGDPTGDTAGYRVSLLPSGEFKTVSIHCGPAAPCVLYVGQQFTDFGKPHTFVPLAFKGAAPVGGSGGTGAGLDGGVVALGLVLAAAAGAVIRKRRHQRAARLRPEPGTP